MTFEEARALFPKATEVCEVDFDLNEIPGTRCLVEPARRPGEEPMAVWEEDE